MENKPGLIYKKMAAVMSDIGTIGKDQKNTAQGFSFRGIEDMLNNLYPVLVKHGVFVSTDVLSYDTQLKEVTRSNGKPGTDKHSKITMKYTFHAEDGSSISSTMPAEGLDSGDKSTNKALSAALKYALIQTFMVPTKDVAEADFESPTIGTTSHTTGQLVSTPVSSELQSGTTSKMETGSNVTELTTKPKSTFRRQSNAAKKVEAPVSDDAGLG